MSGRAVTVWTRVDAEVDVDAALADAELVAGDDGPLVAVLGEAVAPEEVADVLGRWIAALRDAMDRGVDVVTVVPDDHLEGDDVGRLSVGHGVVAGSRAYGFEGQRDGLVANVVVGPLADALDTARWVLGSGRLSGQVLLVGDAHHGRQRP